MTTPAQIRAFLDVTGAAGVVVLEEVSTAHREGEPCEGKCERRFEARIATGVRGISKTGMLNALRQVVQGFEDQLVRGEPRD